MRILGVSRKTIMQRVKYGELSVAHLSRGKQKGVRICVIITTQNCLNPLHQPSCSMNMAPRTHECPRPAPSSASPFGLPRKGIECIMCSPPRAKSISTTSGLIMGLDAADWCVRIRATK